MESSKIIELIETAKKIATSGKGILAADESTGTIKKRFDNVGVENTYENRSFYRSLLFSTQDLEKYISGVILFDETLRDQGNNVDAPIKFLVDKDIVLGIKLDLGLAALPGSVEGEQYTQGLDGLGARCKEYYDLGCRFAKWRCVLTISESGPSTRAIRHCADTLAQYAVQCQENGLVPIIEPEILQDGTHTIARCEAVATQVLREVFNSCAAYNVLLEGALLKPSMVSEGSGCTERSSPETIGFHTVRTLVRTVPAALAGINFLSGGFSEANASIYLNAINTTNFQTPWNLSFSFGRALQASCIATWAGLSDNKKAAQDVLIQRCEINSKAASGTFDGYEADEKAKDNL